VILPSGSASALQYTSTKNQHHRPQMDDRNLNTSTSIQSLHTSVPLCSYPITHCPYQSNILAPPPFHHNQIPPQLSNKADNRKRDSWLARQQRKKTRRTCICWAFWLGLLALSAVIVVVVVWLLDNGYFAKLGEKIDGA